MPRITGIQGLKVLALMAIAALLAVGCGGGGDDETSTGSGQVAAADGGDGGASGEAVSDEKDGGGEESAGGEAAGGEPAGGDSSADGFTGSGPTSSALPGGESKDGFAGDESGRRGATGGGNRKAGLKGSKAKKRPSKSGSGSSGGGANPAPPLSAEAFLAAADEICKARREDTRQGLSDFTKVGLSNLEDAAKKIVDELVIPSLESEMREIEALNPPASADGAVSALFAGIEGMIASGKAEPRNFILKGDAVASSEEAAKQNGFTVCGGI
jgi:hypothetical protein